MATDILWTTGKPTHRVVSYVAAHEGKADRATIRRACNVTNKIIDGAAWDMIRPDHNGSIMAWYLTDLARERGYGN